MRRSLLFIPGNQANMIQNGMVLDTDALIFDLEDSVLPRDKDAARDLVASALLRLDFGKRERIVRVNDMKSGWVRDDLLAVLPAGCQTVLLPKAEGEEDIRTLDALLLEIEEKEGLPPGTTGIIALIETAMGVEKALETASASSRMTALALGAEDLAADLGCPRTLSGNEIFYSRSRLLVAARAAGIEALDTPFTDARDLTGLEEDIQTAKSLGFTGKLSISPHHLETIHRVFTPSEDEVARALDTVRAMEGGKAGAVSLGGRMIDAPVLRQAEAVLERARASGLLKEDDHDARS